MPFKESNIITVVYSTLVIVGLILCIVGMFSFNSSIPMLTICGYSCMIGGLLLIMGSLMNKLNTMVNKPIGGLGIDNKKMTALQVLDIVRINIIPFLLIFITLIFILVVTIQNQTKISGGWASSNYYLFMNLNIVILCLETYILSSGNFNSKNEKEEFKSMPLMYSTFTYFLWLFNLLFCIIQYNELTYFTTDG